MSRYTGSIYRKSRRYGISLLENNKEFSKGKKRTYAPGQHIKKNRKLSGYGEQLQEKQRIQFMYGMNDRQFRRFFTMARNMKGSTSYNILAVLESRLDNLVYRMGFAPTRRAARQLVTHGHILVNNKKCNIPSSVITLNSEIMVKEASKKLPIVQIGKENGVLAFVEVDHEAFKGKYLRLPLREELNQDINETYVVEWYNRLVK